MAPAPDPSNINEFTHPRHQITMSDISVTIKSSGDAKYEVTIDTSQTILELKQVVAEKADIPAERQRLIYSGKVLKDSETISSYKIQNGHTIHLVKSAKSTNTTPSTTATASATNTDSTAASGGASDASSQVPSSLSAGLGAFNPLADLTGARYAGYTQLPSASMFGPDGGMNAPMPDAEQMSQMMSNPMVQESMNNLLSDPRMLDYLIQQSPQLRAMGPQARQMLQSPFFRQMMLNPEMMRLMMEMGRNSGLGSGFPAPGAAGADASTETGAGAAGTGAGGAGAGTGAAGANPFASMLGGMDPFSMFGAPPAPAPEDNRPPEERYASQLSQLNDMGFFDFDRNVAALRRSGGNVQGAVEYLLSE